jgi:ATP-binding cassette subfamily C protein
MPIYLGICFLFHFWIGVTALIGALLLVAITVLTEMRTIPRRLRDARYRAANG